jgi:proteasome lid subunit RPN8/RPN11
MSDTDIQFGNLEEPQHVHRLRPDRNKQLAVVTCGQPVDRDLRVFVELDVMRDMQAHALSNTGIELGGVLLGGQYKDDAGVPFVVVGDSLRAQHYESSQHSFKFTHDTWAEITRQRQEFPPDLHMIGWYHTHPGFGVFLSGMDLFICEHFFRGELDVALVIDPRRGECGWFHWTGEPQEPIRRAGGFSVYASRHRQTELELFAAQLEDKIMGTNDPRSGGFVAAAGPYPAPVVNLVDSRFGWQGLAVIGMLGAQFLLLVLLAWQLFLAPSSIGRGSGGAPAQAMAAAMDQRDRTADMELRSQQLEAQAQLLDRVVGQLSSGSADGVVRAMQEAQQENERLRADARVYRSLEAKVKAENEKLTRALDASETEAKRLSDRVAELQQTVSQFESTEKDYQQQIAALKRQLQPDAADEDADEPLLGGVVPRTWLWGIGAAVVVLIAVGATALLARRRADTEP